MTSFAFLFLTSLPSGPTAAAVQTIDLASLTWLDAQRLLPRTLSEAWPSPHRTRATPPSVPTSCPRERGPHLTPAW
jgi:hypothetical protein